MENYIEIPEYLINNVNPISVAVIGMGGTGSWVLGDLAALHHYLIATGRKGLHVIAYDGDIVTEANIGRQNFSSLDIGQNKAVCLVEKYNRFHGLQWDAVPLNFDASISDNKHATNITISCVDSIASRMQIIDFIKNEAEQLNKNIRYYDRDLSKPYFLLDCGNGYDYGQVIISEVYKKEFKTFADYFPDQKEAIEQHSCSVLESLGKQNLFINKFIANFAVNWLYEGIRNTQQDNLGYFFNYNSLNPIYL